ncbi:hemin uptake protein HemP [Yoonia sp. R2331]|uniref:hemin uptake protein HemP n=1 Tax=Yoonia sp. R2331 TaxID=3237238 RepID=UPI0034E4102D
MDLQSKAPKTDRSKVAPLRYDARDLIKTGAEARIDLDGQVYVLRITRAGKLILTK